MIKISTTSICKDEIKNIDDWYNFIKDEVDFITVLDTGSTDGTWERLEKLASRDNRMFISKVETTTNRFDEARNFALNLIPDDADIIVSIDFDERFSKGFGDVLRKVWEEYDPMYVTYTHVDGYDSSYNPSKFSIGSSIVKNDRLWQWKYPINSEMVRTDGKDKGEFVDLSKILSIYHFQDLTKDRGYYIDLYKERVEETEYNNYSCLLYGRELYLRGMYEESSEVLSKITDSSSLSSRDYSFGRYLLGLSYYYMNNIIRFKECLKESISIDNGYRDPYVSLSQYHMNNGEYREAKWLIEQAMAKTTRKSDWSEMGDFWTDSITMYDLYSVCCFNSNEKLKALGSLYMALQIEPENKKLLENFTVVRNSINDTDFS